MDPYLGGNEQEEHLRRAALEHFRAGFEHAAIGLTLVLPDGRLLRVNEVFCDFLGYEPDELLKLTWTQLTHEEDLDLNRELVQRALTSEDGRFELEKRYLRNGGEEIWALTKGQLLRNDAGEPLFFFVQVADIDGLKQVQNALAEQTELYETLLGAASDLGEGVSVVHLPSRTFVWANEAMAAIYGYTQQELLELEDTFELVPSEELERVAKRVQQRRSGEVPHEHYETFGLKKDGSRVQLEVISKKINDEHVMAITRDITDRKLLQEAEEMMRRAELLQKQALQLNDSVVQGLAVAKMALELGEGERAVRSIEETLATAQAIISDHLRDVTERRQIGIGDAIKTEGAEG